MNLCIDDPIDDLVAHPREGHARVPDVDEVAVQRQHELAGRGEAAAPVQERVVKQESCNNKKTINYQPQHIHAKR